MIQRVFKRLTVFPCTQIGAKTVLSKGFRRKLHVFILTNSRGFTASETEKAHKDIAAVITEVAAEVDKEFLIISRGDSTLRGHYPLETEVLKKTVEQHSNQVLDGEVIFPFFKEGGRFTVDNIHYVQDEDYLVPAGETEFAKDRTFGYSKSHLGEWVEEKSEGNSKQVIRRIFRSGAFVHLI